MGENGDKGVPEKVPARMGVGVESYKYKKKNARENGGRPYVDVLSEVDGVQ